MLIKKFQIITSLSSVLLLHFIGILFAFPETTYIRGPPLDNIKQKNGGGDAENGIRQISKEECQIRVNQWYKTSGTASGPSAIEKLEMLMQLDRLAQVMPGNKPKRLELLSFGLFSDGQIDSIAGIAWQKLTLPNEMKIICLCQMYSNEDHLVEMLQFIDSVCKENAIIPDYSSLEKYDILKSSLLKIPSKMKNVKLDPKSLRKEELRREYATLNKVGSICLDNSIKSKNPSKLQSFESLNLGHYWYKSSLQHLEYEIPFYFRQKKGRDYEYEVRFSQPEAGTLYGSGTVGGALIIPIDRVERVQAIPEHKPEEFLALADALRSKIIKPP